MIYVPLQDELHVAIWDWVYIDLCDPVRPNENFYRFQIGRLYWWSVRRADELLKRLISALIILLVKWLHSKLISVIILQRGFLFSQLRSSGVLPNSYRNLFFPGVPKGLNMNVTVHAHLYGLEDRTFPTALWDAEPLCLGVSLSWENKKSCELATHVWLLTSLWRGQRTAFHLKY
jgi:hypothetical protein